MTTPAEGTPSTGPWIANCSPGRSSAYIAGEETKRRTAPNSETDILFTLTHFDLFLL
jgi:hypothetical protein